jgi:hypothetical protein
MPDADDRPPADDIRRPGRVKLFIGFFWLLAWVALAGASLAGSFWLFANDAWGGLALLVAIPAHILTIALYGQALAAPSNASIFGMSRWTWVGLLTLMYVVGAGVTIAARLQ